jgi:hypothetical protein
LYQRTRFPAPIFSPVSLAARASDLSADGGHLGRSVDLVAPLLVNSVFCRISCWYAVASGSGISKETSRNSFWNLTAAVDRCDFQE